MTSTRKRVAAQLHSAAEDARRIASTVTGAAEIKKALAAEFPAWSIIHTDRDRWWAMRRPVRDPETGLLVDHPVTSLDANTAEELRAKLRRVVS